jgi:hypothetical protein
LINKKNRTRRTAQFLNQYKLSRLATAKCTTERPTRVEDQTGLEPWRNLLGSLIWLGSSISAHRGNEPIIAAGLQSQKQVMDEMEERRYKPKFTEFCRDPCHYFICAILLDLSFNLGPRKGVAGIDDVRVILYPLNKNGNVPSSKEIIEQIHDLL